MTIVSRGLFFLCVFFSIGIILRSFWEIDWIFFLNFFVIFLFLTILFSLKQKSVYFPLFVLSLIFLGLALGIWRIDLVISQEDSLRNFRDTEKSVEITGVIIGQPSLRENNIQYTLLSEDQKEKILISLPLYPKYFHKDKIKIKGKLQTPAEFEDFSYKDYLLKDKVRTVSYYPEAELIKRKSWTFYGQILKVKDKLREANQKILSSPQSEILGAMILGDKQLLPKNVKENFSKIGLSHILAISGMHIAIIVGILVSLLNLTRLRNWSFYLVSGFLIFYILLIGLPPSALRAGIMAGILLLSLKVKRKYMAERALFIAATLMLLFNPMFLRYDVGFQLSFFAVFGILQIGQPMKKFLQKLFHGHLNWLSAILAITLSAQLFTLPIIIYNFGIFSLVSPLMNIVVVPLLPLVIVLGILTLLIGSISTSAGIFIAFPLYLILSFIIWLANFTSKLKLSFIELENFHFFWVIGLYFVIFALAWRFKKSHKKLTSVLK